MKKKYLLLLFALLPYNHILTFAEEDQINIFVSPGISFGHVHTDPDNLGFQSNSVGFGGKVGALYGWNIKTNYYLSSGLMYGVQQIGFKNGKKQTPHIEEQHNIHYLQLPVLLKLYTGEIALDLRCYVNVGFIGAFKVNNWASHTTYNNQKEAFIKELNIFNLKGLIGFGVEYQFSLSTSILAGISYQPSLRTFFSEQDEHPKFPTLYGYGHVITLDIGIVL